MAFNPESGRNCFNANLRKAMRAVSAAYEESMRAAPVKGTQYTMLLTISGFGTVTIGQLASFQGMDQSTVTRSVRRLYAAGYVSTSEGEDRREKFVSLSKSGRKALEASYPHWLEAQMQLRERLGGKKAKQLLRLTQELADL